MVAAIKETASGVTFAVRVHPRAKKTEITGVLGEGESATFKLALNAPPVDGRANEAVIEFFAELLGVARSEVRILFGERSKSKVIHIANRTAEEIEPQLRNASRTLADT